MFKIQLNFIIQGDWECGDYNIVDRLPEVGDMMYYDKHRYYVVDMKEIDDNVYDVYLD